MNRFALLLLTFIITITLVAPGAFAKEKNETRPGWGFGDENHIHTGPPGQSVRPHQENDTDVDIEVNEDSNSGHNSVHHTDGPVTIVTGAVTHFFSFVINTGHNIFHI